jgi:hypothetical protein
VASNFPTSLDNFTNPSSGNTLDSPSHSLQHSDINDAVEALEAKLGIGASPAGSATSGQVLTASTGGTTTWSTPTAPGLIQIVPTSVAVGSGSGSVDALGNVTFTNASSISLNNCFTSVYDNYKILMNTGDPATNQLFTMRFRVSGSDNSSSIYYRMNFGQGTSGSTSLLGATQTSFGLGYAGATSHFMSFIDVFNPFVSTLKSGISGLGVGNNSAYNGITGWSISGWYDATTSFDGFSLLFGANTTGSVRVYGYRD